MKKRRGYTIVELLVTLGITCIIITLSMTFFNQNLKNYKYINNDAELQFQTQYILNFMANKILESRYIELVKENTTSHLKKVNEQNITKISFRYGNNLNQCYNFEIRFNKIYYGNTYATSSPGDELGRYVKEMKVTPMNGKSFEYTEAVIVSLTLEMNKQQYEMEQIVYMRNFDKEI